MAIPVISISSDSSDESVGSSPSRIILFGTIPAKIPAETPTIPPVVSTLPHTSPFLYIDSSDSDTIERQPSQDPYEVIVARWRSRVVARSSPPSSPTHDPSPTDVTPPTHQILPAPPGLPRRPEILILPGQPIPVGRLYRTQPNGSHSPSDHFSPDDFSSDTSSGSSSGYLSGRSIADSSFDSPDASFAGQSGKRRRSPAASVPLALPVPGALSPVRADLLPPRKRIRGSVSMTNYEEYNARVEVDTRLDREDEDDEEAESSHREDFPDLVSADASREVMQIGLDVVMQELYDHMVDIPVRRIMVIESVQRDQGHRMMATSQQSAAMSERIGTLERGNMRLRAMLCIKRERIDSPRRHMAYTQEELRQIRRFRYYCRVRFGRLETYARRHLALAAYQNREPTRENGDGHGDDNGNDNGNGNGEGGENRNGNGLGGGNGNGNPNVNVGGVVPAVREYTYQDFLKCQPLIFKGNEGVVGLTRWRRTIGTDAAYAMTWKALMKLMTEVYCRRNEI
ncbi:hypothetical protein Tco_0924154 [Tanacetum coccineum]|uniref:Uncharacterized protein n=1 Tax=Tanacetum coccineum TaxID=301880 RepID=A0ABQ5D344_9ASTR